MRPIHTALLFVAVAHLSSVTAHAFVWRTENIKAEVREDLDSPSPGQYLYLTQVLKPGEEGWTMMKLALPSHWKVEAVTTAAGKISIVTTDNGRYELTAENVSQLDFDILDGGAKPDPELERLWQKHALIRD
jgi:hypothetical protein